MTYREMITTIHNFGMKTVPDESTHESGFFTIFLHDIPFRYFYKVRRLNRSKLIMSGQYALPISKIKLNEFKNTVAYFAQKFKEYQIIRSLKSLEQDFENDC